MPLDKSISKQILKGIRSALLENESHFERSLRYCRCDVVRRTAGESYLGWKQCVWCRLLIPKGRGGARERAKQRG